MSSRVLCGYKKITINCFIAFLSSKYLCVRTIIANIINRTGAASATRAAAAAAAGLGSRRRRLTRRRRGSRDRERAEDKPSDIFAVLTLSHQGTQAYEEVLSHKTVSSEDDKKEGKGPEEEAKIL